MIQIRQGVFETNSSSTHSITMCSESEFKKWKKGEVYLNNGWKGNTFVTKNEAISLALSEWNDVYYGAKEDFLSMGDEDIANFLYEYFDLCTYENYWNNYLESFENAYITESGDKVIAFGQYGYDG